MSYFTCDRFFRDYSPKAAAMKLLQEVVLCRSNQFILEKNLGLNSIYLKKKRRFFSVTHTHFLSYSFNAHHYI